MSNPQDEKNELTKLSVETGDIVLKLITDSAIFDEIPLLASVYKFGKAAFSIPNILFLRKMERFMQAVNDGTTEAERCRFAEQLKHNQQRLEEFYEYLLLRVEKIDDVTKPDILGRIYASRIAGKLLEDDFQGLCHALNSARLGDLAAFSKECWITQYKHDLPSVGDEVARSLISTGLVTFNVYETEKKSRFGVPAPLPIMPSMFQEKEPPFVISFSITELGYLYAHIAEGFEDFFSLKSVPPSHSYQSAYEFTGTRTSPQLKQAIKEKWDLSA